LNTTVSCNPYRIWEKTPWGGGGGLFPSLMEKNKEQGNTGEHAKYVGTGK
jgi:hypothetical protein